jgi:hypothetical protein
MSVAVVLKCLCCLIVLSLLTAEVREPIHMAQPSATFPTSHDSGLRSVSLVGSVPGGTSVRRNIRPSVVPVAAFSQAAVPRDLELGPLAVLGSALLMFGRLLRKFNEQREPEIKRKPEVRGVAAGAA